MERHKEPKMYKVITSNLYIDGVSDEENILNHWVKHYKTVFSCNERNDVELNNVKDDLCNITFTDEMIVNSHDIMTSISSLCRGKLEIL